MPGTGSLAVVLSVEVHALVDLLQLRLAQLVPKLSFGYSAGFPPANELEFLVVSFQLFQGGPPL